MNDILLSVSALILSGVFVRACKQTNSNGVRVLFFYVFVCILLWCCIVVTEANITSIRSVRYIGATFKPGYLLLTKKYPSDTFGKKYEPQ